MSKPTIAILYICTGEYIVFWKNFFESAEKFLLPAYEKHYFVFTDAEMFFKSDAYHVHRVHQKPERWPYPTLNRFAYFKSIEKQISTFDYIYFFNANCRIHKTINALDFLPNTDEELVVTQHPGFWNKPAATFTYERNHLSKAYIPEGEGEIYAAGGLNGGSKKAYLAFIDDCYKMTNTDLQNNIIARWHDESYLNKYILRKKIKILHPGYLFPDKWNLPFEKIIHLEDKKMKIKGFGKYSICYKLQRIFHFFKK